MIFFIVVLFLKYFIIVLVILVCLGKFVWIEVLEVKIWSELIVDRFLLFKSGVIFLVIFFCVLEFLFKLVDFFKVIKGNIGLCFFLFGSIGFVWWWIIWFSFRFIWFDVFVLFGFLRLLKVLFFVDFDFFLLIIWLIEFGLLIVIFMLGFLF